jgi:ArsR family transcriptional regulator
MQFKKEPDPLYICIIGCGFWNLGLSYMRLCEYSNIQKMETRTLVQEINLLHERICSALGDSTRILILYLLSQKDLFVNELADELNTPQSTVSRHLKILRERNLVTTKRQGTAVLYSLADQRIIRSLDLMREILAEQIHSEAAITNASQETTKIPLRS